jgi:hypothetical protein
MGYKIFLFLNMFLLSFFSTLESNQMGLLKMSMLHPRKLSQPHLQSRVMLGGISGDASLSNPSSEGKSYSRRKHRNVLGTIPSRKFPRLANIHTSTDDSIPREAGSDVAKDLNDLVHKVAEDGKSSSTAFVVSPTVSQPLLSSEPTINIAAAKATAPGDGKTVTFAIYISPTAVLVGNEGMASSLSKKATIFYGKSKFIAYQYLHLLVVR